MQRLIYFCLFFSFQFLEARLYFLHIPKTGGTTLRLLLEQQFSEDEIYPFRNRKAATRPVEEELVLGHFPYWFCKQIDPDFHSSFKVTILRDPVERYLSFLRAKKRGDPSLLDLEAVLNLRKDPNNRYKEGLIDNALCRYLANDPSIEGEALLESAKLSLHDFDHVLFFDNFNDEVGHFFKCLGIDLNENEIPKTNATIKEAISQHVLEVVTKLNALDIQLYEYAKKHIHRKYGRYPLIPVRVE